MPLAKGLAWNISTVERQSSVRWDCDNIIQIAMMKHF